MATTSERAETESEHFSPYRVDGKLYGFVCIVTGATQPVGRAIVTELAAHGVACVYACSSSSSDDYAGLAQEVNQRFPNTKVIGYPFTLANEEETLGLIDDVLNAWGRLDVYITLSDTRGPASISSTTPGDVYKAFEANAMAPFLALKYAPPAMTKMTPKGNYPNAAPKDRPYGSIIVVSSVANISGGCGGPAFTMSSHAALGVVRTGVAILKNTGIRINCISAGWIEVGTDSRNKPSNTNVESIGLGRAGLPQEVARVAGFLASGFSSYTTGANVVVDGGASAL